MSIVPLNPWLAHRPRRGAIAIDTVVLHAGEQLEVDALVRELRATEHSYHYIIDRDGTVLKCVPFAAVGYHCQNSYGPHEASRRVSLERDGHGAFVEHTCVNEYSVGVCLMNLNDGQDPYPASQIAACIHLLIDLKTPLPKLRYLTTHAYVAPGRHTDPAGLDVDSLAKVTELELWTPQSLVA